MSSISLDGDGFSRAGHDDVMAAEVNRHDRLNTVSGHVGRTCPETRQSDEPDGGDCRASAGRRMRAGHSPSPFCESLVIRVARPARRPPDRWPTHAGDAGRRWSPCRRGAIAAVRPSLSRRTGAAEQPDGVRRVGVGAVPLPPSRTGQDVTEEHRLKKLIRERMARTGESYSTARRHVVRPELPALPSGLVSGYDTFGPGQRRLSSLAVHLLRQAAISARRRWCAGLPAGSASCTRSSRIPRHATDPDDGGPASPRFVARVGLAPLAGLVCRGARARRHRAPWPRCAPLWSGQTGLCQRRPRAAAPGTVARRRSRLNRMAWWSSVSTATPCTSTTAPRRRTRCRSTISRRRGGAHEGPAPPDRGGVRRGRPAGFRRRPRHHRRAPGRAGARPQLRRELRLLRHASAGRSAARWPHEVRMGTPIRVT